MPVEEAEPAPRAAASPTKSFFVTTITRDITLEDCVLDLIDNSVDGAWKRAGSAPMGLESNVSLQGAAIVIEAYPDRFTITDNCGGMKLRDAEGHAFTFGKRRGAERPDYGIGVYGIGMKRAVFKMGNRIEVRSTSSDDEGTRSAFYVSIDVPSWMQNDAPPWDFPITDCPPLPEDGVAISVADLNQATSAEFGNPRFIQNLRRQIARDYAFHLARGLRIALNGQDIVGWKVALLSGEPFEPVRIAYDDAVGEEPVYVEIVGGMAAPPPDDPSPDEATEEGENRWGWYVVCNGRIVLASDKTSISGWGTAEWPQWHYQYNGFIGIVFFSSRRPDLLPLTTTKRSVDVASEVFRRARPKMRDVSKSWVSYTNQRKQDLEEAKRRESTAALTPIQEIRPRPVAELPLVVRARPREAVANVNYAIPKAKLRRLADALGNARMSHRDVGLKSFDYAYDELVGDE